MKLRKDNAAMAITVGATIALLLIIPQMHEYANSFRNEPGWGGECIAWLLPGLMYALVKTIKETMEN